MSHALRHAPWLYELELDGEGWAPVDQLVDALRAKGGAWEAVDGEALADMIESSAKRRFELVGDRIRALYGHSLPGRIERQPATPPDVLYHGTAPETWEAIRVEGLQPIRRQYVHLSVDKETAVAVGKRKSTSPVLLSVAAAAAAADGVEFYMETRQPGSHSRFRLSSSGGVRRSE
ncbi:RNA 2'-phosphotransferase [Haloechinothrix halophila]|uniref:RNA 2'-phosphotransferase n=1 Tax=Haloechinothrix halophila TaxID=1069073 RepID=UPI0018C89698|nr:RNA 2'-phosphotransferase [Haloechinothrix halophila]